MRRPNSQRSDVHRSMALKLTIFTATEITTASRWAAIRADAAANTQTGAVWNLIWPAAAGCAPIQTAG